VPPWRSCPASACNPRVVRAPKVFPPRMASATTRPTSTAWKKRRIGGVEVETACWTPCNPGQPPGRSAARRVAWTPAALAGGHDRLHGRSRDRQRAYRNHLTRLRRTGWPKPCCATSLTSDGTAFRYTPEGQSLHRRACHECHRALSPVPTALVFRPVGLRRGPKGRSGRQVRPRASCPRSSASVPCWGGRPPAASTPRRSRISPRRPRFSRGPTARGPSTPSRRQGGKASPVFKSGRPSEVNHGTSRPASDERAGGVTIDYAKQSVCSRWPRCDACASATDVAGQPLTNDARNTTSGPRARSLPALGLVAVVLQQEADHDLRSRCCWCPSNRSRSSCWAATASPRAPSGSTAPGRWRCSARHTRAPPRAAWAGPSARRPGVAACEPMPKACRIDPSQPCHGGDVRRSEES